MEIINVVCVILLNDLKHIILNQSKTFQNLDTTQQMDCVYVTSVTITPFIMEHLIINTENILKRYKKWEKYGTALKPAHEPILMFRKPLAEKTVADNVMKYGTGGINIDDCRINFSDNDDKRIGKEYKHKAKAGLEIGKNKDNSNGIEQVLHNPQGRFPANIIHDGSDEVEALFPDSKGQCGDLKKHDKNRQSPNGVYGKMKPANTHLKRNDNGSAGRFFYCAKVSKKERNMGCNGLENKHLTLKPVALMSYLIKLVTPENGRVLDPFMGSGSTGIGCVKENFDFIGIEQNEEYFEIAKARIKNSKGEV